MYSGVRAAPGFGFSARRHGLIDLGNSAGCDQLHCELSRKGRHSSTAAAIILAVYNSSIRSPCMAFTPPPDKIMFEIYKDVARNGDYRVIYFTELDDHNREAEINRAANGEHIYDGFIRNR